MPADDVRERAALLRVATTLIDRTRSFTGTRRGRLTLHTTTAVLGLGLAVPIGLKLADEPFPVHRGNVMLIAIAGSVLLVASLFKARGWALLFARHERPATLALAAAGGGASVSGLALPGRFDEVVRIAIVRRLGSQAGIRRVGLSLLVLGMVDAAALTPLAIAGSATSGQSAAVRTGLAVLAAVGIGAGIVLALLPRILGARRIVRFRIVAWLNSGHIPLPRLSAAWLLVFASWALRATAILVLMAALGLGWSPALAILLLCAGSAAAAIPIGPGGAATQVGAGAAVLVAAHVHADQALAAAVTTQTLGMLCGALVLGSAVVWKGVGAVLPRLPRLRT